MQKKYIPLLSLLTILFVLACGFGAAPLDSIALTVTPMSALVRETVTARAVEESGSGSDLATAVSKATESALGIHATQTARASLNDPSRLATSTAIAPVVAELPRYDVDPASGYVAWIHNPVTINLDGFQKTGYANDFPQITAADFAMAADIQWNTRNSLSGCGFMFRSDGDTNKPSQYNIIITRTASGHLAFLAMIRGELSNYREFFPKTFDNSFNWFNDSTNRLAIVARKNLIDVYTNGVHIGQIDVTQPPPDRKFEFPKMEIPGGPTPMQLQQYTDQSEQYDAQNKQIEDQLEESKRNFNKNQPFIYEGLLGFLGLSQSGQMVCTFSNAWLFILNP